MEDAFITFRGLRVHIKVFEPEGELKRRVFVLSSPITQTFNWRKLTGELVQLGCFTAIMDLPGFGQSACGPGVPHDAFTRAQLAWGVIDELDAYLGSGESSWHLMGHGSACQTLLTMSNLHPDSVSSQVYISPLLNGDYVLRTGLVSRERWFDYNISDPGGYRRFMDRLFACAADNYVTDTMRPAFIRRGARESFVRMLAQKNTLSPLVSFSPVMALTGDRDEFCDQKSRDALRELIPEAERHVINDAGHMPMETHSHALRDFLRGWLRYVD